jgi:hypothetical protein
VTCAKRIAAFVDSAVTVVVAPVAKLSCPGIDPTPRVVAISLAYAEVVLIVVGFGRQGVLAIAVRVPPVADLCLPRMHIDVVVVAISGTRQPTVAVVIVLSQRP